jgi:hypothetical protein
MSEKLFEDKFNKVLQWIINFIGSISPNSFFGEYGNTLNGFIMMSPSEPITYFIEYIYKNDEYRTKLKNMDDTYFMNQDIMEGDTLIHSYIKKIFYFKELWVSLDSTSRLMIKKAMKGLIIICKKYIDVLHDTKFEKYDIKNRSTTDCCKSIHDLADDYISKYDNISLSSSSSNKKNTLKYVASKSVDSGKSSISLDSSKSRYDASSISLDSSKNKSRYDASSISLDSSKNKSRYDASSISLDSRKIKSKHDTYDNISLSSSSSNKKNTLKYVASKSTDSNRFKSRCRVIKNKHI